MKLIKSVALASDTIKKLATNLDTDGSGVNVDEKLRIISNEYENSINGLKEICNLYKIKWDKGNGNVVYTNKTKIIKKMNKHISCLTDYNIVQATTSKQIESIRLFIINSSPTKLDLTNYCIDQLKVSGLGMASETLEMLVEIINTNNGDKDKLVKEIGDVLWYITDTMNIIEIIENYKEVCND